MERIKQNRQEFRQLGRCLWQPNSALTMPLRARSRPFYPQAQGVVPTDSNSSVRLEWSMWSSLLYSQHTRFVRRLSSHITTYTKSVLWCNGTLGILCLIPQNKSDPPSDTIRSTVGMAAWHEGQKGLLGWLAKTKQCASRLPRLQWIQYWRNLVRYFHIQALWWSDPVAEKEMPTTEASNAPFRHRSTRRQLGFILSIIQKLIFSLR